jgi:hypothetical protein
MQLAAKENLIQTDPEKRNPGRDSEDRSESRPGSPLMATRAEDMAQALPS